MTKKTLPDPSDVELLEGLLARYSPSGQERPAVEYLVAAMAERGFESHMDGVGNAVGTIGQGEREVLLLGHIDTVAGWIDVRREGNLLHGRGAVDAKGPLCTFVIAAQRAAAQISPHRLRITVIGAVEEEAATSRGARYVLTSRTQPSTYVIIGEPSGWNKITLGYKGRLLIDYVLERPTSHTAGRETGVCEEMVAFWQRIREYTDAFNRGRDKKFDVLDPSLRHVHSESDGLFERVQATVALRLPLDIDLDATKAQMAQLAFPGQVKCYAEEVAFRASKNTPLTRAFTTAIRMGGNAPAFKVKTGTSDMNVVGPAWNCPIVAYGPGDSNLDHTPHEHIDLEEYTRAIEVLTQVLILLSADQAE